MNGRRWTPQEDDYLKRYYNRANPQTIAQRLNRTPKAIQVRANRLGIQDRIPHGYTPVAWVHPRGTTGHHGASHAILKAAKRDGVLRQAHHVRGAPNIAPDDWIENYLAERQAAPTDTRLEEIVATWVPTRTLAKWLGIPKSHAAAKLLHNRGWYRTHARFCRRYRVRHLAGQPFYWHPTDAKRLVEKRQLHLARASANG